ncbi:DNA-directed DNA/RNA polymerase mu isoform X2 [Electrophorus electricus]|uniref:DNA-directed DNA/RNA polymerase mu isoform X2 n=1 Tax=Electrophorus electricus TaxID=8005 RepID=UPI0015CFA1FB|nr:DNA-directed DNA/RNA polymerase mu isoform X2 [Electrophorus electricus]
MVPLKRRKVTHPQTPDQHGETCKFNDVAIFIIERKMGASRKSFLTQLGRSKGFRIEESYSPSVTHVVSENNTGDEVQAWITNETEEKDEKASICSLHLLDISWLTESIAAESPLQVQDRHRLKVMGISSNYHLTLTHFNCVKLKLQDDERTGHSLIYFIDQSKAFCTCCSEELCLSKEIPSEPPQHIPHSEEPLEILAENAEFMENEGRNIAFRRSASVLKALPRVVRRMEDLKNLPCLGGHSLRVIKALTGVFGVGVKSADRWFREGLRNPSDLIRTGQKLNHTQQAGVRYYNDLNKPVTKKEAEAISDMVGKAVRAVLPGAILTLTGGFRRGKEVGHDVDFLITHPEEGAEEGMMPKVLKWLEDQGLLLYQKTTRNSYLESRDGPERAPHHMDRFERCFSIFKLEQTKECSGTTAGAAGMSEQQSGPSWRAVRVDLVVSPYSQFAYATLGWTGSKLFERDLRRWAGQERGMSLSNHALYDSKRVSDVLSCKCWRHTRQSALNSNTFKRTVFFIRCLTVCLDTKKKFSVENARCSGNSLPDQASSVQREFLSCIRSARGMTHLCA